MNYKIFFWSCLLTIVSISFGYAQKEPTPAIRKALDEADAHFEKNKYMQAYKTYMSYQNYLSPKQHFNLGDIIYYNKLYKNSDKTNPKAAEKHLVIAAEDGSIEAITLLAEIYSSLLELPNFSKAIYWFEKIIEKGNAAYIPLAKVYFNDVLRDKDKTCKIDKETAYEKGFYYLEKAASKTNKDSYEYKEAIEFLGDIYRWGSYEKEKDYQKAIGYYSRLLFDEENSLAFDEHIRNEIIETAEEQDTPEGYAIALEWAKRSINGIVLEQKAGQLWSYILEKAKEAYAQENYIHAREFYEILSGQGDKEAKNKLAEMHTNRKGLRDNEAPSPRFLKIAADQGNLKAILLLIEAIEKDPSLLRAYKNIFYWYRKAYDLGETSIALPLGKMYYEGDSDNSPAPSKAFLCFKKEFQERHTPETMLYLGVMFYKGIGIGQNKEEAIKYLTQGAEAGEIQAMLNLGYHYRDIQPKEARKWLTQAAQIGNIEATFMLAQLLEGIDYREAKSWYEKMAVQGNTSAMLSLAELYKKSHYEYPSSKVKGKKIHRDNKQVLFWIQKALDAGSSQAKVELGKAYMNGTFLKKNVNLGLSMIKEASDVGNPEADYIIGVRMNEHIYNPIDYQAYNYIKASCDNGYQKACDYINEKLGSNVKPKLKEDPYDVIRKIY